MSNMVVRTNVFAINAHRNMGNVGREQARASNRLSSGFRINSAADDAAGLAISETMRSQIRGLDQASRNAQDGQSMLQTTEGGLDEIGNMLQRVRELAVQASNDIHTQEQRDMVRQEIDQLGQEIQDMQNRVEFNTTRVLARGSITGSANTAQVEEGIADMGTIRARLDAVNAALTATTEIRNAMNALNNKGAKVEAGDITAAIAILKHDLGDTGVAAWDGTAKVTHHTSFNVTNQAEKTALTSVTITAERADTTDLNNRITDLTTLRTELTNALQRGSDEVMPNLFANAITVDPSVGNNVAFFQVGANSGQGITFDFGDVASAVTRAHITVDLVRNLVASPPTGSGIGQGENISISIGVVQSALDEIANVRANLGAVQNRMDYTMRSLDISSENLQSAESRIRDTDVAREMMRFTMSNVLSQAAVSMLSQANQLPNNLLQLLR